MNPKFSKFGSGRGKGVPIDLSKLPGGILPDSGLGDLVPSQEGDRKKAIPPTPPLQEQFEALGGDWRSPQPPMEPTTVKQLLPVIFRENKTDPTKMYSFTNIPVPSLGHTVQIESPDGKKILLRGKVVNVEWIYADGEKVDRVIVVVEEDKN